MGLWVGTGGATVGSLLPFVEVATVTAPPHHLCLPLEDPAFFELLQRELPRRLLALPTG